MKYRRNKKHKLQIIACLLLIEISFLFLTCKSFTNKNVTEAKEYANFNKNTFALYVEDENGVYVEIKDSNTFPTGYNLNTSKSVCTDTDGNRVEGILSYKDDTVILASRKTVFCYLYFDQVLPDLTVIVEDENNSGILPNTPGYTKNITCKNGSAPVWNYKYDRLEFSNVVGEEEVCRVTYTKDTNTYPKLTEVVKEAVNSTYYNGYRYSGSDPNNYIWFNNEMWRIIGSIPVCINSSQRICSETKTLVKIIRMNSLGMYAYDNVEGESNMWGDDACSLYTILNNYYYGQRKYSCEGMAKCKSDFTVKGINSNGIYGNMIQDVYWRIGVAGDAMTPATAFDREDRGTTIPASKIGLINISDYGYAVSKPNDNTIYSNNIDTYGSYTKYNWLYKPSLWMIQHDILANDADVLASARMLTANGKVLSMPAEYYSNIYPVVYLKSGVYKKDGNGTITNPYIIAIDE